MELYQKFPVHIQNSLSRTKEVFTPIEEGRVGMYVCGPTVYSEVHLGNVRTFVTFDLVFRYLQYLGYKVRYVRNITDVGHLESDADEGEDKIAKKAKLQQLEPMEIVQRYTNNFHEVMGWFNALNPSIEPTATGHIMDQIEMIQRIIDNGLAYESKGSVYFDVEKYNESADYGKLSGRKIEDLMSNTRDLDGQDEKRNPLDFALWKNADPSHIMRWKSPWGVGFPGWHLECSVMSTKYLGTEFDIHGGGMDLKFPHHECEIAQCTGADRVEAVRYWMHGNMLTVNGEKMSKSKGNGFTPKELISGEHPLLDRGYSPMTIRFFMLQAHYGSTLDFSNDALDASDKGLKKLMRSMKELEGLEVGKVDSEIEAKALKQMDQIFSDLSDDFNSPKAIAGLFELGTRFNDWSINKGGKAPIGPEVLNGLKKHFKGIILDVLGLKVEEAGDNSKLDGVMGALIKIRSQAKLNKDFATADKIRDELAGIGIKLKDNPGGETSYLID